MTTDKVDFTEIKQSQLSEFFCKGFQIYLTLDNLETFVYFGDRENSYKDVLNNDECKFFIGHIDGKYVPAYVFSKFN